MFRTLVKTDSVAVEDKTVPVRYFEEASSISFQRSVQYGLSTLGVLGRYWLDRLGIWHSPLFEDQRQGRRNPGKGESREN